MAEHTIVRDAVIGAVAGAMGTVVMERFFRVLKELPTERLDEATDYHRDAQRRGLDDVSQTDVQARDEEAAPETLGRAVYEKVTGDEPSDETREKLGSGLHWGMGLGMGALYGMLRGDRRNGLDLKGGVLFGTGVWVMADELVVPMLGLAGGPTSQPPSAHLKGLGAHVVYGVATAATAQLLEKVV